MTVISDLSPTEPALQRFDKWSTLRLSAKNVDGSADWQRCAREFSCDSSWKTSSSSTAVEKHLHPFQKGVLCQGDNVERQPKAKKKLVSRLADEVVPSKLSGECCFLDVFVIYFDQFCVSFVFYRNHMTKSLLILSVSDITYFLGHVTLGQIPGRLTERSDCFRIMLL